MYNLKCIFCNYDGVFISRDMRATRRCGRCERMWLPSDEKKSVEPEKAPRKIDKELLRLEIEIIKAQIMAGAAIISSSATLNYEKEKETREMVSLKLRTIEPLRELREASNDN